MSLISVSYTLFKSPGLWDKVDLDCILGKDDQLFNFIDKFRYIGMKDLTQEFLIESSYVNVEVLENKTGEIRAGAYLLSIAEVVNSAQQTGLYLLLIITFWA